ncbi:MAG TPA: VOC family protein, partial [Longimicrobium sp.]|nr:VOC family protein [Longimicrobium sp.]
MLANRSIPDVAVIPVLAYADVAEAAAWLCRAFGFSERVRIGNHRVQLTYGAGAVVARDGGSAPRGDAPAADHSVMVRVDDADAHHARAVAAGARILQPPADHPF